MRKRPVSMPRGAYATPLLIMPPPITALMVGPGTNMMSKISAFVLILVFCSAAAAQSSDELLKAAQAAFRKENTDEAIQLAGKALQANPKNLNALAFRAGVYESIHKYANKVWGISACPCNKEELKKVRDEYSEHDKCRIL